MLKNQRYRLQCLSLELRSQNRPLTVKGWHLVLRLFDKPESEEITSTRFVFIQPSAQHISNYILDVCLSELKDAPISITGNIDARSAG